MILNEDVLPLDARKANLSKTLDDVIMAALRINVKTRTPTANDFLSQLRRAVGC